MARLSVAAVALMTMLAASVARAQDQPVDLPCVTWEPLSYYQNTDPTDLFVAAYTWVIQDEFGNCIEKGDIFPCFASDPGSNSWGHHDYQPNDIPNDYCRLYINGSVYLSTNMYVPKKGPKWHTWKWKLAQTGGPVPDNAIRFGDKVMARSTENAAGECCGKGFTGWAHGLKDGTFGSVHFSIVQTPVTTDRFEVAVCEAYHPTTTTTTPAPPTPAPSTPAPPTPAPTLPPNNKPYIRFGNAIASPHNVDATITQGNVSYTWTNYRFGEFSGWVEVFADGFGTIDIWENTNGARGPLLVRARIPLTPGPLVVALKDYWPPQHSSNVETIAASYVPIYGQTGVRLFNLSPDTASAGMQRNGKPLVDKILYTLGSGWAIIDQNEATFAVFDDKTGSTLASDSTAPPEPPFVFTNFLLGLQNASNTRYQPRLLPLIDAPEQ